MIPTEHAKIYSNWFRRVYELMEEMEGENPCSLKEIKTRGYLEPALHRLKRLCEGRIKTNSLGTLEFKQHSTLQQARDLLDKLKD